MRRLHLWLGSRCFLRAARPPRADRLAALLAFYPEIDALLHPEIRAEAPAAPGWDRALAKLRAAYPDKTGPWRLEVTGEPGVIQARYYNPPERAGHAFRPMMVWLSPDGGAVLRRDYWG